MLALLVSPAFWALILKATVSFSFKRLLLAYDQDDVMI